MTRAPLAPAQFPDLPPIKGVEFATAAAQVRYQGRPDVLLVRLAPGSALAGVTTRSATRAAPVLDCEAKLGQSSDAGAAILVNAGNANAFTGAAGEGAVQAICAAVAGALELPQTRVLTSSTGVIGERLPEGKITGAIAGLAATLGQASAEDAASAIMTTDTFAKGAGARVDVNGTEVSIMGIAKGSGMIAPDMATMLVYLFTDAQISQSALQALVAQTCDQTFNCITVDSDTSTSDTLLMAATGASGAAVDGHAGFASALHDVMLDLAHQVVRDGEGATKFVEVTVTGATTPEDARKVARAIADSPLVKTAIAGEDPNWGRIVMAVGKSGAQADRDRLLIRFGPHLVAENGWVSPAYSEDAAAAYMRQPELLIAVDLGLGDGAATMWTCDLTHGYIDINADYRS